jgi:hypothetical protein
VLKRPRRIGLPARRFAIGSLAAIAAVLVVFVATRDALRWPGYGGSQAVQVAQNEGHTSPPPRDGAVQNGTGAAVPAAPGDGHDTIASVRPTESVEPSTAPASPLRPEGLRAHEGTVSMAGAKPGLGSVSTADEVHEVGSSQPAPPSGDPDSISPSAATVAARDASAPVKAYVAVLAGAGKNVLTVHLDPRTRALRVGPVAVDIPAGKTLQLWYSRNGGPFRSIGPVAGSPTELTMPADMAADGSVIGASLEPLGGATSDGPTAPVVYQGQMRRE